MTQNVSRIHLSLSLPHHGCKCASPVFFLLCMYTYNVYNAFMFVTSIFSVCVVFNLCDYFDYIFLTCTQHVVY